jgi:hypothetical protein
MQGHPAGWLHIAISHPCDPSNCVITSGSSARESPSSFALKKAPLKLAPAMASSRFTEWLVGALGASASAGAGAGAASPAHGSATSSSKAPMQPNACMTGSCPVPMHHASAGTSPPSDMGKEHIVIRGISGGSMYHPSDPATQPQTPPARPTGVLGLGPGLMRPAPAGASRNEGTASRRSLDTSPLSEAEMLLLYGILSYLFALHQPLPGALPPPPPLAASASVGEAPKTPKLARLFRVSSLKRRLKISSLLFKPLPLLMPAFTAAPAPEPQLQAEEHREEAEGEQQDLSTPLTRASSSQALRGSPSEAFAGPSFLRDSMSLSEAINNLPASPTGASGQNLYAPLASILRTPERSAQDSRHGAPDSLRQGSSASSVCFLRDSMPLFELLHQGPLAGTQAPCPPMDPTSFHRSPGAGPSSGPISVSMFSRVSYGPAFM